MLKENLQDELLEIGRNGCYLLCLIAIAALESDLQFDILTIYHKMLDLGYIKPNCFVKEPKAILEELTNRFVTFKWADANYKATSGEYVIKRWIYEQGKGALTHFVLYNSDDKIIFNPTNKSPAFIFGKVIDTRVFEVGK